jgi:hypothetical protein
MGLKKVRRPVKQESEKQIGSSPTAGKKIKQPVPHEPSEAEKEFYEKLVQRKAKEAGLDRVISFMDNNVSMQRQAKIQEGDYHFRIEEITFRGNFQTQYGLKDQYVISFSLDSEATKNVPKLLLPYNISNNQQSALMIFLSAFNGVFRGRKVTFGQLVGLTGHARIHHVVSDIGNVFEKIEILSVNHPKA